MLIANYITPPSALLLTTDKLSSELFGLDEDELNVMLKDKSKVHKFIESEPKYEDNRPKGTNEVTTKFQLQYHDCLDDALNLSFFDQIIMSVCMTEFIQRNTIITPNIIHRDLGGIKMHSVQFERQIQQSLHKLSNLEMRLNATQASKFLFQVKGTAFDEVRRGFVLPAEEVTVKLNGQCCQAYKLTGMSVVFEYARCKGHLAQIPIAHLNIPHTKNTLEFMLIKMYIYMRVLREQRSLAHSKKKQPAVLQSIKLETLYEVCGFTEQIKQRKFRMDLMMKLIRFMDHLVGLGVIHSYQLVDDQGVPRQYLKDCVRIEVVHQSTATK